MASTSKLAWEVFLSNMRVPAKYAAIILSQVSCDRGCLCCHSTGDQVEANRSYGRRWKVHPDRILAVRF